MILVLIMNFTRNMAYVEMNKVLAQVSTTQLHFMEDAERQQKRFELMSISFQLFRRYTVIIPDPSRPIKRHSCLSISYSDLMVRLVPRKGRGGINAAAYSS